MVVVEAERLAAVGRRMVERAKAEVVAAGTVRVVAVVMLQVVYVCSLAATPRLKAAVPTAPAWRFQASCSLPTAAPPYPRRPG